jgi:hypothetical protein
MVEGSNFLSCFFEVTVECWCTAAMRWRGWTGVVLAPMALPGERIRAAAVREKPALVRARVLEVLHPSPERVTPECPYFGRCGGCHYQHAPAMQLEAARHPAEELAPGEDRLPRIGSFRRAVATEPRPLHIENGRPPSGGGSSRCDRALPDRLAADQPGDREPNGLLRPAAAFPRRRRSSPTKSGWRECLSEPRKRLFEVRRGCWDGGGA